MASHANHPSIAGTSGVWADSPARGSPPVRVLGHKPQGIAPVATQNDDEKRRDEVLKRMLQTPPKKHVPAGAPISPAKRKERNSEGKRSEAPRKDHS